MLDDGQRDAAAAWTVAGIAIVALGSVVRLLCFLHSRPLWVDEAMLANNVIERSWADLLAPLDANQAAPPGFLLLVRSCVAVFGTSELSLRLVPFVCGVATIPLTWLLARRTIGVIGAFFAALLVAFHPPLVYYATELKPYAVDACLAVVVPLAWLPLFTKNEPLSPSVVPRARFGTCIAVCVLAAWFSHPAAFVVAGCSAAAVTMAVRDGDWLGLRRAMIVAAAFLVGFGIEYAFLLRPQAENAYLRMYWKSGFVPWEAGPRGVLVWIGETSSAAVDYPLFQSSGWLVLIAGLVGGAALWRENRPPAFSLLWTFIAAATASGLHAFPLRDRLLLWSVPLASLVLAAGLAAPWLWGRDEAVGRAATSPWAKLVAIVACSTMVAPMMEPTFLALVRPDRKEDLPAVLEYVRSHAEPGDTIYVYPGALPAFRYYIDNGGDLAGAKIVEGRSKRGDEASWVADVERLEGRTWFVFSHIWNDPETGRGEDELLRDVLGERARPLDVHEPVPGQVGFDRAVVLLYDLPSVE